MDLAGSVVGACCSCVFPPLGRQLGYVAKVGERVKDLVRAMRELKARSKDVTARIEDQRIDPTRLPTDEVEEWLRNVHEVEDEVNSIKASYRKNRCRCLGGCSANICSNWKIGRKATYVLLRVNDLSQRVKDFVINVTRAGPPPPGQLLPGTANLLAMEFNLKKVMDYLHAAADKALTIGIFGMGGVGKTTLLKAINNQLCSSDGGDGMVVFQHVIWVVVSRNASVEKLQKDIALKLQLPENATSMNDFIFNFLNNKKFILLLDDVWERLDLGVLGIPDRGRFVLFTTRSEEVCGQMEAGKKIKVECLQKEEAWHLFVEKVGVGIIRSSPEIKILAEEVAEECEGLPLALTVLGRAMASKRTPSEWRNTLASLKKSQPGTSNNIQEPVFDILKHSYDSLRDEAARRCFLFCALYPEDYSFGIDELIKCFWGIGLIDAKGCNSYGEIYDRGYDKIVGVLKSACLLEGDDTKVKMHDVIRDMALWIARDCGGNDAKWIVHAGLNNTEPLEEVANWEMTKILSVQFSSISSLPMLERRCEKLSALILHGNGNLKAIPRGYLKCLPALTYLDLSHTSIMELPDEVSSLIQLQYLNLSYTSIRSLSISLRNLKKLKHLILCDCYNLEYIPYGLISCLLLLQSLDMYGCYSFDFSSENFIGDRAHLEELKTLKQLKFIALVKKYGRIADLVNVVDVVIELVLDALQDSDPQDFITNLMKVANGIENLTLQHFHGLKELILTSKQVRHKRGSSEQNLRFSRLGWFVLKDFKGLRKITWTKIMLIEMFPRLTRVDISGCWDLQNLTWTGHLPCLRSLLVIDCKGLKEIISADEDGEDPSGSSSSIFPSLYFLYLDALENLHSISNAILDTPKLSQLIVIGCPKLKRLPFSFQQQITEKREIRLQFEEEWWGKLEWYDTSIKSYFSEQREFYITLSRTSN